jgi:hypothetical protein
MSRALTAAASPSPVLGRRSASQGHSSARRRPLTVTVRTATILDPLLEGVSLAAEGSEFGRRVEARSLGWDLDLYNDALRFQARCDDYAVEMRRLAALVG